MITYTKYKKDKYICQNVETSNILLLLFSDLSKIINSAKYNYNFYTGYNLWDSASSAKRLPALKPIINPGKIYSQ